MSSQHERLVAAVDEALWRDARRKRLAAEFNESMGMFVSCIGGAAFLYSFLPGLLSGVLAWVLAGGVVLSAAAAIWENKRRGVGVLRTLIGVVLIGAMTWGLVYGCYWYFMVQLLSQPGLFQGMPGTTP